VKNRTKAYNKHRVSPPRNGYIAMRTFTVMLLALSLFQNVGSEAGTLGQCSDATTAVACEAIGRGCAYHFEDTTCFDYSHVRTLLKQTGDDLSKLLGTSNILQTLVITSVGTMITSMICFGIVACISISRDPGIAPKHKKK
jgi:hypothetical protein